MWINDIGNHKFKKYSQYGEEGYLQFIFKNIGIKSKFLVDIGENNGTYLSNTKQFRNEGWTGILIDGKPFPDVHQHYVSADNIIDILKRHNCPEEFDLLSLDIDGQDYWVLRELLREFRPRVIISEYNSEFTDSRTIEYDPNFYFKATDYYGYTFEAGLKLADEFGYRVIFQNANLNMYYLRKDEMEDPDMLIDVHHPLHLWWRHNTNGQTDTTGKWVQI
jgi:hypothetical protein